VAELKLKQYKARIEIMIKAENMDEALKEVYNCLALGVSTESVDVQQITEIPTGVKITKVNLSGRIY
jgi:hypothetical protein